MAYEGPAILRAPEHELTASWCRCLSGLRARLDSVLRSASVPRDFDAQPEEAQAIEAGEQRQVRREWCAFLFRRAPGHGFGDAR